MSINKLLKRIANNSSSSNELDNVKNQCIYSIKNKIGNVNTAFSIFQHEFIDNDDTSKETVIHLIESYLCIDFVDIIRDIMYYNGINNDKYDEIYKYVIDNSPEINLLTKYAQEMSSSLNKFNTIIQQYTQTNRTYKSVNEVTDRLYELEVGYCLINLTSFFANNKIDIDTLDIMQSLIQLTYKIMRKYINVDRILQEHWGITKKQFQELFPGAQLIFDNNSEYFSELYTQVTKYIKQSSELLEKKKNIYEYLKELDNDDKINQFYGEIDYDPHDLWFRKAPIVVYRDFTCKPVKDIVLIGPDGDNHPNVIKVNNIGPKATKNGQLYISECYWYDPCAFIETTNGSYTVQEVARILKKDPRVFKVYLSPGPRGRKLKRLAKLIGTK